MSGIEQAIEKMVQDATADLRHRIEALEALADAVRIAVHVGKATAVAEVPPPAAERAKTAKRQRQRSRAVDGGNAPSASQTDQEAK